MREATFENALAFAQDLIRIPSMTGAERDVAARLQQEMEALGFDRIQTDELGSVVGVVEGTGGAPPVMVSSHLDVVAEGDHEEWEHPPFSGVVEDGFLHGRGAMDIKGPLALQTYAAAALKGRTTGDVIVGHVVFEERGGWGMETLIGSGSVKPSAVIIGESTHGDIAIGHRGRAEVEIVIRGLAGHASAPDRARNALDLVPMILAGVEALAGQQETDPVLGPSTLVATGVTARPESPNVIPDEVVVVLDWRILPSDTEESLLSRLEAALARTLPKLLQGYGVECRLGRELQTSYTGLSQERRLLTPGFLMDADHPVVTAATRAVGRPQAEDEPAHARPWTFATDGGWASGVFGIPTVGFAPGEERYAHTNRERLEVEEARWAFSRYPGLILAVQEASK